MTGGIPQIRGSARLTEALEAIEKAGVPAVAVTGTDGSFAGYITRENLAELMMVHSEQL